MSERPTPTITVGRLKQLLNLYDDKALVEIEGDGALLQITEADNGGPAKPATITLSARRK